MIQRQNLLTGGFQELTGSTNSSIRWVKPWIFTGRTDAKAGVPIVWPPHTRRWLIGKDPDAGKDWGQPEKGVTEDEMVGWHHWLNGHEFEQAPGVGDRQGSLVCCSPWGLKESDMTEQMNWTEHIHVLNTHHWTLWLKDCPLLNWQSRVGTSFKRREWGRYPLKKPVQLGSG